MKPDIVSQGWCTSLLHYTLAGDTPKYKNAFSVSGTQGEITDLTSGFSPVTAYIPGLGNH